MELEELGGRIERARNAHCSKSVVVSCFLETPKFHLSGKRVNRTSVTFDRGFVEGNATSSACTSPRRTFLGWRLVDARTELDDIQSLLEPSLIRGGPFYQGQQAIRLIRPNKWNMGRRITLAVIIGWLPLVVLTTVLNPGGLVSFLHDYRVYSRLLIAVPILLLGQAIMESRFRMLVSHFLDAGLITGPEVPRMQNALNIVKRLRDSTLPELAILLLVFVHTATTERTMVDVTPWLADGTGTDFHLTAAGWYAVLVSATIFQFLLGLSLWKWFLWTIFAFKLSRLKLNLVPTHPDEHGGLGFLSLTPIAFSPVIFAVTCVIGSTWRHEILAGRAILMTYKLPAIILVCLIALIALGPLAFFVTRLAELRRQGVLEYGVLGQLHSMHFHKKWILSRAGHEAEFLTAPECSTLADFGSAYEKLKELKPFPVDRDALIALALSVLIPIIPVILAAVPLVIVLKTLLQALK